MTKKVGKKVSGKKAIKKKSAKKMTKSVAKKATKKVAARAVAKKKVAKKAATLASVPKAKVKLGAVVPSFSLPATGEKTVALSELLGKKVVLFFYPKDSTPGCTIEGHDFTRLKGAFKSKNVEVFGVSRDSMKSHENFKAKQGYKVDLISDPEEELCGNFGVIKLKNMYGKKVRGIERSTFLLDESGKLIKEWRGVKVPGHADEVLDFVNSL